MDWVNKKAQIVIAKSVIETRCHFCHTVNPIGKVIVIYKDLSDIVIMASCIEHEFCFSFLDNGFLCDNHSEGIETLGLSQKGEDTCNDIPF